MAMMAMTTSSSISVNPRDDLLLETAAQRLEIIVRLLANCRKIEKLNYEFVATEGVRQGASARGDRERRTPEARAQ
jgi:hypothetical protein